MTVTFRLPKVGRRSRIQLARASTQATSKFMSPRWRAKVPVKPVTLRLRPAAAQLDAK